MGVSHERTHYEIICFICPYVKWNKNTGEWDHCDYKTGKADDFNKHVTGAEGGAKRHVDKFTEEDEMYNLIPDKIKEWKKKNGEVTETIIKKYKLRIDKVAPY